MSVTSDEVETRLRAAGLPDVLPDGVSARDALATADAFFQEALAVNLDEVVAEPVSVAIVEYADVSEEQPNGSVSTRRRRTVRTALIDTYVPMSIFNRMMKMQRELRASTVAAGGGPDPERNFAMMTDAVLMVWKLTEPDMTRELLEEGLTFAKIGKLFALFFGEALRLNGSKAPTAATSSASNA